MASRTAHGTEAAVQARAVDQGQLDVPLETALGPQRGLNWLWKLNLRRRGPRAVHHRRPPRGHWGRTTLARLRGPLWVTLGASEGPVPHPVPGASSAEPVGELAAARALRPHGGRTRPPFVEPDGERPAGVPGAEGPRRSARPKDRPLHHPALDLGAARLEEVTRGACARRTSSSSGGRRLILGHLVGGERPGRRAAHPPSVRSLSYVAMFAALGARQRPRSTTCPRRQPLPAAGAAQHVSSRTGDEDGQHPAQ